MVELGYPRTEDFNGPNMIGAGWHHVNIKDGKRHGANEAVLIACGQGLAAYGGAVAVGARTTTAVVLSIFAVIAISAVFTFFFTFLGV